jgi:hypothetical protein
VLGTDWMPTRPSTRHGVHAELQLNRVQELTEPEPSKVPPTHLRSFEVAFRRPLWLCGAASTGVPLPSSACHDPRVSYCWLLWPSLRRYQQLLLARAGIIVFTTGTFCRHRRATSQPLQPTATELNVSSLTRSTGLRQCGRGAGATLCHSRCVLLLS